INKTQDTPAMLSPDEWDALARVLADTRCYRAVEVLRKQGNAPQQATDLFPSDRVNNGHEYINTILYTNRMPLRLTRIGAYKPGEQRANRALAFVRWEGNGQIESSGLDPRIRQFGIPDAVIQRFLHENKPKARLSDVRLARTFCDSVEMLTNYGPRSHGNPPRPTEEKSMAEAPLPRWRGGLSF